jgi:hypothetical protein
LISIKAGGKGGPELCQKNKRPTAMTTNTFLAQLDRATRQLIATVQAQFEPLELSQLNHKPAPDAWSILECLEHLNRYSRYYNPALAAALAGPAASVNTEVRYSWLGRKSIEMMGPGSTKKAKTLKHMNPSGSVLGREVLTEFYQQQEQLLKLLAQAHGTDLNRKAVPIEFFKLLKMRVGESFEFVVLHEERHVQQALRVKAGLGLAPSPSHRRKSAEAAGWPTLVA